MAGYKKEPMGRLDRLRDLADDLGVLRDDLYDALGQELRELWQITESLTPDQLRLVVTEQLERLIDINVDIEYRKLARVTYNIDATLTESLRHQRGVSKAKTRNMRLASVFDGRDGRMAAETARQSFRQKVLLRLNEGIQFEQKEATPSGELQSADYPFIALNEHLAGFAARLSEAVQVELRKQERLHKVNDPQALVPVRWTNAPPELVSIHPAAQSDARDLGGSLEEIAQIFRKTNGRLIVLGRPGAGKSVLAIKLALALLNEPDSALPVPVVLPLHTWHPRTEPFTDWITRAIRATYRDAQSTGAEVSSIRALVERRGVLPILDGFDEIAPELRETALRAINGWLNPSDQLVITSRPDEYAGATHWTAEAILASTAGIQLEDLTPHDLEAYFEQTTPKQLSSEGVVSKWTPVLDRLRETGDAPAATILRSALATPLMTSLARTIYADRTREPVELLNTQRYPDARSIERLLLSMYVTTALDKPPQDAQQARNARRWKQDDSLRWLGFLAVHLYRLRLRDIQWWNLRWYGSLSTLFPLLSEVWLSFLVVMLVVHKRSDLPFVANASLWYLGGAFVAVLFIHTTSSFTRGRRKRKRFLWFARYQLQRQDARWIYCWIALSVVLAILLNLSLPGRDPLIDRVLGLSICLLLASAIIIAGASWKLASTLWVHAHQFIWTHDEEFSQLSAFRERPVSPDRFSSPQALYRAARQAALSRTIFGSALLAALMSYDLGASQLNNYWWLVAIAILSVPLLALLCLPNSIYSNWRMTHLNLALKGWLPWRALDFFDYAQRCGLLRVTGTDYQFRHALLQEYFASHALESGLKYTRIKWLAEIIDETIQNYSLHGKGVFGSEWLHDVDVKLQYVYGPQWNTSQRHRSLRHSLSQRSPYPNITGLYEEVGSRKEIAWFQREVCKFIGKGDSRIYMPLALLGGTHNDLANFFEQHGRLEEAVHEYQVALSFLDDIGLVCPQRDEAYDALVRLEALIGESSHQ